MKRIIIFISVLFCVYVGNAQPWTPNWNIYHGLPSTSICIGSTVHMWANTDSPGTWSSTIPAVATITSDGVIEGVAAGTSQIRYTTASGSARAYNFTVSSLNGTVAITGDFNLCSVGSGVSTTQAFADVSGGTWSESGADIASINSSTGVLSSDGSLPAGVVYTKNPIVYQLSNGCRSTVLVSVNAAPAISPLNVNVCAGLSVTFTGSDPSGLSRPGTYSNLHPSVSTIDATTGVATGAVGITNAYDTILYTYTGNGCYVKAYLIVKGPEPIVGPDIVCVGSTGSYSSATPGGGWTSSNTAIATIDDTTGVVTGVSGGIVTITYTTDITGTPACPRTKTIAIGLQPVEGDTDICVGETTTLTNAISGGTWSSSNTSVATIDASSGSLTGIAGGTATITYSHPGCYTTTVVTVGSSALDFSVCERTPIEICGDAFAYCPGLVLTVGGGGSGTSYSWDGAIPATETSEGDDLAVFTFTAAPTSGTYVVTASGGSGCSVEKTIKLIDPGEGCRPCEHIKVCNSSYEGEDAQPSYHTIVSADLTAENVSPTTPGRYFISGYGSPVTLRLGVSPAPGSVFFMGDSVTLEVRDSVVLDSVHFFASPDCKWSGISIANNSEYVGKLKVMRNTLIENAVAGVLITGASPVSYLPTTSNILETENSIYNRNAYGVWIGEYVLASSVPAYPFLFTSSVFTSRNFCNYNRTETPLTFADCYPFSWPEATQLRAGTETGANPAFGIDAFPSVFNSDNSGVANNIGIFVDETGHTDSSASGYDYYGVVIGDSSVVDDYNLFDTLSRGVVTLYGNIKLYNNIFRLTSGDQVSLNTGVQGYGGLKRSIELGYGSQAATNNRFYNCGAAVLALNWPDLVCRKAKISVDFPTLTTDVTRMTYGIRNYMSAPNSFFDRQIMEDNTITDCKRSIDLQLNSAFNPDAQVVIENNTLSDNNAYDTSDESGYAVNVKDVATTTDRGAYLSVNNNSIEGFCRGIYLFGTEPNTAQFVSHIDNNTVVMNQQTGAGLYRRIALGITSAVFVKTVTNNHIYGDVSSGFDFNGPGGVYPAGHTAVEMISVSDSDGTFTDISCNYAHDVMVGFRFLGENSVSWHNNVMARHSYGFVLDSVDGSGAEIGDQGASCNPMDNIWIDDAGSTGGWPGSWNGTSTYQTMTVYSDADLSKFYTRPNSGSYIFRPTVHTTASSGVAYSGSCVLAAATSGCEGTASICSPYPSARMAGGNAHSDIGYTLAPNPGNGTFVITRKQVTDKPVSVRIYSTSGAVVYKAIADFNDAAASIDISTIANGLYLVVLSEETGQTSTIRMVKQ